MTQYHWGYYRLEYHWGYSEGTLQLVWQEQSILKVPSKVFQVAVSTAVLCYMRLMELSGWIWMCIYSAKNSNPYWKKLQPLRGSDPQFGKPVVVKFIEIIWQKKYTELTFFPQNSSLSSRHSTSVVGAVSQHHGGASAHSLQPTIAIPMSVANSGAQQAWPPPPTGPAQNPPVFLRVGWEIHVCIFEMMGRGQKWKDR